MALKMPTTKEIGKAGRRDTRVLSMTRSTPDVEAYVKPMEKSTARFCVVKSIELYRYLGIERRAAVGVWAMWLWRGKITDRQEESRKNQMNRLNRL